MHADGQTEAQKLFIKIHHWIAEIDTALGLYHNKTFPREKFLRLAENLFLDRWVIRDWADSESDPMDQGMIGTGERAIDRHLKRAKGLPSYGLIKQSAKELRHQLHTVGAQKEPVIVLVGKKH